MITGSGSATRKRMRSEPLASESAQWQITSWADHSPGAGRHWSASDGTVASAASSRAGPSAYRANSVSRSAVVSAMPLRERRREVRAPHEVGVDAAGRAPPLRDRPHDEGLPALHVARREHAGHARHPRPVAPDVAALREADAQLLEEARPLRSDESHRQEGQVARQAELGPRDFLERRPALLDGGLDADDFERGEAPALVADEAARRHRVDAVAAFFVGGRHAVDVRPLGPRVVGAAPLGRAGQDLELVDGARAVPVHGAEAVRAGVAPADDDDAPVAGADESLVRDRV